MNRFEVYAGVNDHPESSSEHFIRSFHDMNEAKQFARSLFLSPSFPHGDDEDESDDPSDWQWVHVYDTQEAKIILQRYS